MSRVRQSGTAPELVVRRLLREIGAQYRLNVRDLPGRPDIANKAKHKAIFVHGCWWHFHGRCGRGVVPATNKEFWIEKFRANVARDRRKIRELRTAGYDVLVVWDCQLADESTARRELRSFWSRGGARQ